MIFPSTALLVDEEGLLLFALLYLEKKETNSLIFASIDRLASNEQ